MNELEAKVRCLELAHKMLAGTVACNAGAVGETAMSLYNSITPDTVIDKKPVQAIQPGKPKGPIMKERTDTRNLK